MSRHEKDNSSLVLAFMCIAFLLDRANDASTPFLTHVFFDLSYSHYAIRIVLAVVAHQIHQYGSCVYNLYKLFPVCIYVSYLSMLQSLLLSCHYVGMCMYAMLFEYSTHVGMLFPSLALKSHITSFIS